MEVFLFMKGIVSEKEARIMSYGISVVFLFIHLAMLMMFRTYDVTPMVYFNVFSICYYLLTFFLIYKNRLFEYVVLSYIEVLAHMCLAVYFTGWNNGFQITLIGMNTLLFFAEYIGRMLEMRYIYAAPICVIGLFAYLLVYMFDYSHVAAYMLPENISFILQISWGVVVFVINIIFLEIFVLVTFHSEKFLFKKAGQDELTGLFNRYTANGKLDDFIRKDRSEKAWVALIDIDDFKAINDTYGHNYGDYVLVKLAEIMKSLFGDSSCFRWGGEEFLIFFSRSEEKSDAYAKLEQFRKTVEEYEFDYEGTKTHLTITGGIAFYEDGMDKESWVNTADIRLYEGKRNGKNRIIS